MLFEAGILFAFGALVFWAVADFLIQRSTRKFGDWEPLLIITAFATIILTPFIYTDLVSILSGDITFYILLAMALTLFIASLINFEAMKKGKMSVVEPVFAIEVPVSVFLGISIAKESLTLISSLLIFGLIFGIFLVSLKSRHLSKKTWIEGGVFLAILSAILMGTSNFLVGFSSRITNPLLTVWFVSMFTTMMCIFYLMINKRLLIVLKHLRSNRRLLLSMSLFDTLAWVSFGFATLFMPIAIAVGISESYIALAALLGIIFNKEKLMKHQKLGLILALFGAIALAITYA